MRHTCGGLPFDSGCAACVRGMPHGLTPNARFWVWVNQGWVKLTLRNGQSIEHGYSQKTEEGYHCELTRWAHRGEYVKCEHQEWGSDCDGRHEYNAETCCDLANLAGAESPEPGSPRYPEWELMDQFQRDHAAEAAGY